MKIKISQVKKWREEIDATHIVVFAEDRHGQLNVATHGETEANAQEAANAGNQLKRVLGWDQSLCRAQPLPRVCKNCIVYRPDKDRGATGICWRLPAKLVTKHATDKCGHFVLDER